MISVIIPLYNKAPYVGKAIRNVFSQTYNDWELIIIDDGSKDSSALIVERLLSESRTKNQESGLDNGKARLIRQENAGVSMTRNRGVSLAKGEYVCFLDADDWWDEHFLEEIHKAIIDNPEAGIIGANYWYVKNGRQRICVRDMQTGYIDYIVTYLHQMQVGGGMPLWTGAVCVRKDIFEPLGGFNPQLRLGEDFDLWIRIAHAYKVAFIDTPLAFYNQDVEVAKRATRHLYNPASTELSQYEAYLQLYGHSELIQQLISKKRIVAWIPYLQDKRYRSLAQLELRKVDWSNENKKIYWKYKLYSRLPICMLRGWEKTMECLSGCKSWLMKLAKKDLIL